MYRSVETVASFELNNEVYEVDEITTRKGDSFYDIFLILPGNKERFDTGVRCAGLILEKDEIEKVLYQSYWKINIKFAYIAEDKDNDKSTKMFFNKKVKNLELADAIIKNKNNYLEYSLPKQYKSVHIINDPYNEVFQINQDRSLTKIAIIKETFGIVKGE